MRFVKFQGFGNDYIVIEQSAIGDMYSPGELARAICERHYGAGADGIAIIEFPRNATSDFFVRIFNPDGSEAGLSGNGTRCAAAYVHHQGLSCAPSLRLQTSARMTVYHLREKSAKGQYLFDSELGKPTFSPHSIPMICDGESERVINYPLKLADGKTLHVTAVNVGNPHCAIFVEDFESIEWRRIGAELERHTLFPERTNVEFIRVLDAEKIELRIWERGVGETHSSGTCASAAVVASVLMKNCNRRIAVATQGGTLEVEWREFDDEIVLTGLSSVVYEGNWLG